MPRKIFVFLFFLFVARVSYAQDAATQKFYFSDVVIADSLDKARLYSNALKWVSASKDSKTIASDSLGGKISGETSFTVYSQSGVLSKISGKITYNYVIEVKGDKYRYVFDNFIFHYYQQDRNYKMVETGKTRSLNEEKAQGWQKLWDQHRKTTLTKLSTEIADLKTKIVYRPKKEKPAAKKVEW